MALEGYQLIIVECFIIPFSLLLILLRLYIRIHRRGILFSWADFFVVFAWIAVTGEFALDVTEWKHGFFTKPNPYKGEGGKKLPEIIRDQTLLKVLYAELSMYFIVMYSIKFSLLCFYTEIIPRIMTKTWWCMWSVIIFTIISFIATEGLKLLWCQPISSNWTLNISQSCVSGADFTVGLTTTILHFTTDIMIYLLPFPLLRVLPLTKSQKWGLRFTFSIGFLCVVFCLATALLSLYSDSTTVCWIIVIFEYFWANMVVCLPAFKSFLKVEVWRRFRGRFRRSYEKERDDVEGQQGEGSGGALTRVEQAGGGGRKEENERVGSGAREERVEGSSARADSQKDETY